MSWCDTHAGDGWAYCLRVCDVGSMASTILSWQGYLSQIERSYPASTSCDVIQITARVSQYYYPILELKLWTAKSLTECQDINRPPYQLCTCISMGRNPAAVWFCCKVWFMFSSMVLLQDLTNFRAIFKADKIRMLFYGNWWIQAIDAYLAMLPQGQ
jgi:hypothetical protein